MPIGVALYLSGSGRVRVLAEWDRIRANGFASPGRVASQRTRVSPINGRGSFDTAERLARALAPGFASWPGMDCDFGLASLFSGERRVAHFPLTPCESLRSLHRVVCESAAECGVFIFRSYSQEKWVPHRSLADNVPPEKGELFVYANRRRLPLRRYRPPHR